MVNIFSVEDFLTVLQKYHIFDFFIPFLIIWAISYGVMHKIGIFNPAQRAIIAFCIAGFFVYSTSSVWLAAGFSSFIFYCLLGIFAMLILAVFLVGGKGALGTSGKYLSAFSFILALVIIGLGLNYAQQRGIIKLPEEVKTVFSYGKDIWNYLVESRLLHVLIILGILGFIIYVTTSTKPTKIPLKEKLGEIAEEIHKYLKGEGKH